MATKKSREKSGGTPEEAGAWYDEHSATEAPSEPIEVKVERRYDPTFTMRIPEEALARLKGLADAQGVPTTTMARMLLLDALERATDPVRGVAELLATVAETPSLLDALRALVTSVDEGGVKRARDMIREVVHPECAPHVLRDDRQADGHDPWVERVRR